MHLHGRCRVANVVWQLPGSAPYPTYPCAPHCSRIPIQVPCTVATSSHPPSSLHADIIFTPTFASLLECNPNALITFSSGTLTALPNYSRIPHHPTACCVDPPSSHLLSPPSLAVSQCLIIPTDTSQSYPNHISHSQLPLHTFNSHLTIHTSGRENVPLIFSRLNSGSSLSLGGCGVGWGVVVCGSAVQMVRCVVKVQCGVGWCGLIDAVVPFLAKLTSGSLVCRERGLME